MRKKIAILALILVLVIVLPFALTACGPKYDVVVWGSAEHKDMIEDMIAKFVEKNPDLVKVTDKNGKEKTLKIGYQIVSEADASGKITTDIEAGADVFAFANDQLLVLRNAGALAEVTGTYAEQVKANNTEGSVEAATFNDQLLAYPYAADNGYFLYYDKSFFTAEDVKTFEGILSKVTASKQFLFDLDNSWYDAGFFFGAGAGYSIEYNDNGSVKNITCDFDDTQKGAVAGDIMMRIAQYANKGFINGDDTVLQAGFGDGSVVAAVSGTWNAAYIQEKLGDNYAATKLPSWTTGGQTYQMGSFSGYKLCGVNKTSDYPEVAHALAAYLSSEEAQETRFDQKQIGPSNTKVAALDKVQSNIALAALAEQEAYATPQMSVPGGFWTAVEAFGKEVVEGKVTTDNLQAKLKTMADTIRDKSKA